MYVVNMTLVGMTHVPSFMTIGSEIKGILRLIFEQFKRL
jgi:hypothetical protein